MAKAIPDVWADPFADLAKTMEQFTFPGVDMEALVGSRRKEIEAMVAANKEALESLHAVIECQGDIFRSAMQSIHQGIESVVGEGAALPGSARPTEIAGAAIQKAVSDMSELASMARKAQSDALAGVTARAQESVKEFLKSTQPK